MTINIDFGVMANANPVVITDFTTITGLSDPQVISGFLMTGWAVGGLTLSRYSGTLPTSGVMSIAITTQLGSEQNGDNPIAGFMDASGNGFALELNGPAVSVLEYINSVRQVGLVAGNATSSFTAGTIIRLDVDLDTGIFTVFNNGVQDGVASSAKTVTDLAPTIGCDTGNLSANGIVTADFEGVPFAANPIITFDMKDAENDNALILNETGLNVTVYDAAGGTELYQTLTATSHASTGVVVIDDDLVGTVGDTVFIVAVRSNGQTVCGNYTVTNGA